MSQHHNLSLNATALTQPSYTNYFMCVLLLVLPDRNTHHKVSVHNNSYTSYSRAELLPYLCCTAAKTLLNYWHSGKRQSVIRIIKPIYHSLFACKSHRIRGT